MCTLSILLCFDILLLWPLSMLPILHVLYSPGPPPSLLFLGVLLRVGYRLSVCDPVSRDCIAILS